MKLDIDPGYLRTCMHLWKESVDLKVPMKDEFKLHMMQQRESILTNFETTASAWLMAIRRAIPAPEDKADFDSLVSEVEAFEAWAKAELKSINDIAMSEAIQAGIEDLMKDPKTAAAMRDLAKKLKRPGGG